MLDRMQHNGVFALFYEPAYCTKPGLAACFSESMYDCSRLHVCTFLLSLLHGGGFSVPLPNFTRCSRGTRISFWRLLQVLPSQALQPLRLPWVQGLDPEIQNSRAPLFCTVFIVRGKSHMLIFGIIVEKEEEDQGPTWVLPCRHLLQDLRR